MAYIISGGLGFIGINFVKKISEFSNEIFILDNEKNGSLKWIKFYNLENKTKFIKCDLSNLEETSKAVKNILNQISESPQIYHFAANSDIPSGTNDSDIDLKDTFMTTYNLLKICKQYSIRVFNFSSSSAVYGDHGIRPIKESHGPLMPISNYGAMKLASEAQCFAAFESFLDKLRIFRFPNVVGTPATHGVLIDFINNLAKNPKHLKVLGDGTQQKSYLHVDDLINGMIFLSEKKFDNVQNPIFNLASNNDFVTVRWIAEETVKFVSSEARITFGKSNKGWVGDIPKFAYDTSKVNNLGWYPSLNSKQAILKAIKEIYEFNQNVK